MRINNWLRSKLRIWLGVSDVARTAELNKLEIYAVQERYRRMENTWQKATEEIVDVNFHNGNTRIVIAATIGKQTYTRWFDMDFQNIKELNDFSEHLARNDVRCPYPKYDAERELCNAIRDDRKRRRD